MKRRQFLRELKKWCRKNKVDYHWKPGEGKGSHGTVYVGSKKTTVKDGELTPTYIEVVLGQLGLSKDTIRAEGLLPLPQSQSNRSDRTEEMAEHYTYPALFRRGSEGEFIVSFPDLPEALTFGHSKDEALSAAEDCLAEALRGRIRDQEEIPEPSRAVEGARLVAPPAEVAAKAAVYDAFRRAGVTRVALADQLELHESEVRRDLEPNNRTKLDRLDRGARALGGRLEVVFTPTDHSLGH